MKRRLGLVFALLAMVANADGACSFNGVTGVNFGAYNVFSATPDNSTGSIAIKCNPAAPYTLQLSAGVAGGFAPRKMVSGGNSLQYNLYSDSARTIVWGDGSPGTSIVSQASTTARTHTVYGRIPAGQDVSIGSYADTIVITLNF